MADHATEAITLRTYPYGEAHKIAVFLTRDFGILRAAAHGAKASRSRFGSSLEPLTRVQLSFQLKENQDLATLRNCEIIRPFAAYGLSLERNLCFSYLAELVFEFGQERRPDEKLFRLTAATLEASDSPTDRLCRYFELWLLHIEGVLPPLAGRLPEELALKARAMMKLPPAKLDQADLSRSETEALADFCAQLIEGHLEKPLKAKKLLDELL